MDKCVWFFGLLAVVVIGPIGAQGQVYFEDGGKLTLKPTIPADSIPLKSILWKFGPDMVAEWLEVLGPVEYFGPFDGRTSLNKVTGQLEINTLNTSDSGVYSVEFNGKLQSKTYNVKVIRKVSKPTVSLKPLACSSTSDSCTLSCDGGISEAEPITYRWRRDGGDWEQSINNLMNITTEDKDVENFFCQMKNPLNVEESEPQKNPFYQAGSSGGITGVVIGIIFLITGICGAVFCCLKHEAIRNMISSLRNSNDHTAGRGETAAPNELEEKEPSDQQKALLADQGDPAVPNESEEKEPSDQQKANLAGPGEPAAPNESANHVDSASPNQSDANNTSGSIDVEKGNQ